MTAFLDALAAHWILTPLLMVWSILIVASFGPFVVFKIGPRAPRSGGDV